MFSINHSFFDKKTVLITGGTGTLGNELVSKLLDFDVSVIRIFSRDEYKHHIMKQKFTDNRLRFLIGDVRDIERLSLAVKGVDIIIHAAAMKHIPFCEVEPFEAVNTNVVGTVNVVKATLNSNCASHVVFTSTDKAASPFNLYGSTKLLGEKLFTSSNFLRGNKSIKFFSTRYGNVFNSRGSVIEYFSKCIRNNLPINITDARMNRFNMLKSEAAELVLSAICLAYGGEVFIPKLPVFNIMDMVNNLILFYKKQGINYDNSIIFSGIRPGEKIFETLITKEEAASTASIKDNMFVIKPDSYLSSAYELGHYSYEGENKFSMECYDSSSIDMKEEDFTKLFNDMKEILCGN